VFRRWHSTTGVCWKEKIRTSNMADAEQTNMQQDEFEKNKQHAQCFKITDLTNVNGIESVVVVS
jgi:hypothetical protein